MPSQANLEDIDRYEEAHAEYIKSLQHTIKTLKQTIPTIKDNKMRRWTERKLRNFEKDLEKANARTPKVRAIAQKQRQALEGISR